MENINIAKELKAFFDRRQFMVDDIIETVPGEKLEITIEWGDWKHDHLACDDLVEEFFETETDYTLYDMNTKVTEDDGSDTYSAIHTYDYILEDDEDDDDEWPVVNGLVD